MTAFVILISEMQMQPNVCPVQCCPMPCNPFQLQQYAAHSSEFS